MINKQPKGPYGLGLLRRVKELQPETLAAPAGAKSEEAWKPAQEYADLKAIFDERAAAPAPKPAPEKKKRKNLPHKPLPEEPNYFAIVIILILVAGAGVVGYQMYRDKAAQPKETAAAKDQPAKAEIVPPAPPWPEPGAPAARTAAEGTLLESYFPMLLSRSGIKPEQFIPICASAKEFIASYESYKAAFGQETLDAFSLRIAGGMRADVRPKELLKRLEAAEGRGIDLSALKHPANLRGNVDASAFGMDRALANAKMLLESVCGK
jgi:hypothetical protein